MKLRDENVRRVLQIIGTPYIDKRIVEPAESRALFATAHHNRVGLLYLRELEETNRLNILRPQYERNLKRYCQLHYDLRRLLPVLDDLGLPYVLLKTLRYYPANPNDIDVLIFDDFESKLRELTFELEKLGYKKYTKGNNLYNFNRVGKVGFWDYKRVGRDSKDHDPSTYLDLDIYGEIMVEELVHGDKTILSNDAIIETYTNFFDSSSTTARVLSPAADLFYVYFHSIFPTRNLGLEIFYTTLCNLLHFREGDYERFAELTKMSRLTKEIIYSLNLVSDLYNTVFDTKCEGLEVLLDSLSKSGITGSSSFEKKEITFPYAFSTSFFFLAGMKSSLHRKGLQSLLAILVKSFYPPYAANIIRGTFSRKLAKDRYTLKYDEGLEKGMLCERDPAPHPTTCNQ